MVLYNPYNKNENDKVLTKEIGVSFGSNSIPIPKHNNKTPSVKIQFKNFFSDI